MELAVLKHEDVYEEPSPSFYYLKGFLFVEH